MLSPIGPSVLLLLLEVTDAATKAKEEDVCMLVRCTVDCMRADSKPMLSPIGPGMRRPMLFANM